MRLSDVQPNFFYSAQVKQSVIISDKHGIYKLPKDLRYTFLGICEISGILANFLEL